MSVLVWAVAFAVQAQTAATVELSGRVDTEQAGQVRIEILRAQGTGKNTLLLWSGWVQGPSDFAVEIPSGLGDVLLRAALDLKRDGIGPDDPQIRLPIRLTVENEDISDVEIRIRPPVHQSPALPSAPARPGEPPGPSPQDDLRSRSP